VDRALVESLVDRGVVVRPPVPGVQYRAFSDPSGGVSDSFALAIAHRDGDVVILDHLTEVKPPFNPAETTASMAAVLRQYGLRECRGDRYSAMWVVEAFRANKISYVHSDLDRSAIYQDALPLFTSGKVRLLDNDRLVAQFAALERKTSARGDRINHPARGGHHDDLSNAASGALTLAATDRYDDEKLYPVVTNYDGVVIFDGNPKQEPEHPNPWSVPCRLDFRELEKNRLPVPEDPRAGFGTHQKWR
jgi:hypothetical protein